MSDAQQIPHLNLGEEPNGLFDFTGVLGVNETLVTPISVVELVTSDLTITNVVVNTTVIAAEDADGQEVEIGKAVLFSMVGQVIANSPYDLKATAITNSTPPQKRIICGKFTVEDC